VASPIAICGRRKRAGSSFGRHGRRAWPVKSAHDRDPPSRGHADRLSSTIQPWTSRLSRRGWLWRARFACRRAHYCLRSATAEKYFWSVVRITGRGLGSRFCGGHDHQASFRNLLICCEVSCTACVRIISLFVPLHRLVRLRGSGRSGANFRLRGARFRRANFLLRFEGCNSPCPFAGGPRSGIT